MSAQAYALRRRILEVDAWRRTAPVRVCEVHPEVSFAMIAARPLRERKVTWAGMQRRRALLASAGIELPADLGRAGECAGVDDVLDAAVVAWSARRVAMGAARSLPDPPQPLPDGVLSAIWA